jgi:hypothetical protein
VLINAHSTGIEALQAKFTGAFLPESYGAAAATVGSTGNMSSGSAVLTDSSASFTSGDVGKTIIVGATNYSSALVTTIASYQSATQVTLTANAPSAQSNVSYVYGVDCTSAFTSLASAATAGSAVFLAGLYIITSTGPSFNRVRLYGNGYGDMAELATGMSGIISTSPTAAALTENAAGSVFTDFAVLNMSATTPTASTGIKVNYGSFGRKRNLYVSGFYNNVDYTSTSGRFWNMNDCRIMDPINYGVYVRNTTPSGDECDATIYGCQFVNWSPSRNPAAAFRWEAGGGIRFQNNKIVQGYNGSKWQYGVQCLAADNVGTGVMLIENNSIEACLTWSINFGTLTANNANNYITKILIQGNEIGVNGTTGGGILINPQVKWNYIDMLVSGNIIRDIASTGVYSTTVSGSSGASTITQVSGSSFNVTVGMYVTGTGLSVATTATASSGTNTLTVASGSNIAVGHYVNATGVPSGTTVTAVAGTTITISANTTSALSSTAVTFAPQITAINGSTLSLSVPSYAAVSGTATFTVVGSANSAIIRVKNVDGFKLYNNATRGGYSTYIDTGCTNYDIQANNAGTGGTLIFSDKDNGNSPFSQRPLQTSRSVNALTAGSVQSQANIDMLGLSSSCIVELNISGRIYSGTGSTGPCARTKKFFVMSTFGQNSTIGATVYDVSSYSASTTGTASSSSTSLTVASATNIAVGNTVYGAGIATGTKVSAVAGTTITLDTATTAALSTTAVNFSNSLDFKAVVSGTVINFQPYHNETGGTFRGNLVVTVSGPVYSFAETGSTI